ncbi:hypothetical protein HDV00_004154 [Rhizophlyctis rosea]|nr:hypothetical protein HDV00_004154 [Rhizophlyctis rosea]
MFALAAPTRRILNNRDPTTNFPDLSTSELTHLRPIGGMATAAPSGSVRGSGTGASSASSRTSQSDQELLSFIRSCLTLTASLPQGNKADVLLGMEKLDESFHKYAFVRHLQRKIEAVVSPSLDTQLRAAQEATGHNVNPLIASIVDKIMSSPEYTALVSTLLDEARTNVENVARLQEEQQHPRRDLSAPSFNSGGGSSIGPSHSGRRRTHDFSSSTHSNTTDESSSGSLSLTHSPGLEEIKGIGGTLQGRNGVDARLAAIQRLASFSSADLLCGEFWPEAKLALETALGDGDSRVILTSLRIYARAFKAAPPHLTGDVYLSLVSHLINAFDGPYTAKVADGLNTADWKVEVMLRKFRLLNQFQSEITSCWYRFPEQMHKDIMDQTFHLLRTSRRTNNTITSATHSLGPNITPLHYLGIVDPRAQWFEKWMLSKFGRSQVVASMIKRDLLSDLATSLVTHSSALLMLSASMVKGRDEVVVMDVDASEDSDVSRTIGSGDLDYVCLLHSLVMVGKLSLYSAGREVFPVLAVDPVGTLRLAAQKSLLLPGVGDGGEDQQKKSISISIDDLTYIFIKLMCHCSKATFSNHLVETVQKNHDLEALKLSRVTSKILKDIISVDTSCSRRLFKGAVLVEVMYPIKLAMDGKLADVLDDSLLLDVAETLSDIAATDIGKRFILRGEAAFLNPKSTTPPPPSKPTASTTTIDTIVSFVRSSLSGTLKRPTSVKVLGAYIFFLRQLYRTCEGLLRLQHYDLHKLLATTAENASWMTSVKDQTVLMKEWTAISLDNLLNFAGTPKGVLLLQQSGSMEPCVSYMFHRYEKKMQVSKCEKFGYGVLVSQISTTKPGMQALHNTGLIRFFINDLWRALECDRPYGVPDVEMDGDYSTRKATLNILRVFSSFPGLAIVMALEEGKGERDGLGVLVERLVCLDERRWGEPVVNCEESHQIGLRILSLITSSLDSFLLMQANFQFQEVLARLQERARIRKGRNAGQDIFVVDENSLLRNYILVSTHVTGGPGERVLPPIQLQDGRVARDACPMFTQLPVPRHYTPAIVKDQSQPLASGSALLDGLGTNTSADVWLSTLRKELSSGTGKFGTSMPQGQTKECLLTLIRGISKLPKKEAEASGWLQLPVVKTDQTTASQELSKMDSLGITLVTNYISRLHPTISTTTTNQSLTKTLQTLRPLLHSQRRPPSSPPTYEGFDWFLSTIFILLDGDTTATAEWLQTFFKYLPSMYLWSQRSLRSGLLSSDRDSIPLSYSTCSHLVEHILEVECPECLAAFTLSGCTASQICQRWIRELFWNVLPFSEITSHILITLAFGPDYLVYFCIALLRHASPRLMLATREQELILFLNEARYGLGEGFVARDQMGFMQSLEAQYRGMVMSEMRSVVGL